MVLLGVLLVHPAGDHQRNRLGNEVLIVNDDVDEGRGSLTGHGFGDKVQFYLCCKIAMTNFGEPSVVIELGDIAIGEAEVIFLKLQDSDERCKAGAGKQNIAFPSHNSAVFARVKVLGTLDGLAGNHRVHEAGVQVNHVVPFRTHWERCSTNGDLCLLNRHLF